MINYLKLILFFLISITLNSCNINTEERPRRSFFLSLRKFSDTTFISGEKVTKLKSTLDESANFCSTKLKSKYFLSLDGYAVPNLQAIGDSCVSVPMEVWDTITITPLHRTNYYYKGNDYSAKYILVNTLDYECRTFLYLIDEELLYPVHIYVIVADNKYKLIYSIY